ncbi:Exonuclease [Gracilaria domingensis]|nr:Exonuclease [Gracilaria domingensis]
MQDFVREAVFASLRNDEKIDRTLAGGSNPGAKASEVVISSTTAKETATKKRKRVSSNWKQLQKTLPKTALRNTKRTRTAKEVEGKTNDMLQDASQVSSFMKRPVIKTDRVTDVVALDCEMVGVGAGGKQSALARVSIVNYSGDVLYDKFVKVKERVTDYRTKWSGVKPEDVALDSTTAVEPYEAQKAVGDIIRGRTIVGHALKNDLKVMRISHPWQDVRDTSIFFKKLWRTQGRRTAVGPKLSVIVAEVLGVDTFQKNEHDSCEDARAALALYKRYRKAWESSLKKGKGRAPIAGQPSTNRGGQFLASGLSTSDAAEYQTRQGREKSFCNLAHVELPFALETILPREADDIELMGVAFGTKMAQLPRLLHPNMSRVIPLVKLRTTSTPTFNLRRYASESIIRKVRDRELPVLRRQGKRNSPSLKIVFSDETMQRERSVTALALILKRPLYHTKRVSKLLESHISVRKQLLKNRKRRMILTKSPVTGRGMYLPKDEQQFLTQPRRSLLNLVRSKVSISLVDERHLLEISVNTDFFHKFGFTGRMFVDRLPFDIPSDSFSQPALKALIKNV